MRKSPRERDEVDGIYQGDRVRHRNGRTGEVTFADPYPYPEGFEVHVRPDDTDDAEIWLHSEIRRIG